MTKKKITKEFLRLFSRDWDDPAAHQGFRELRELVSGQGQWPEIIDARLMALEKKTAESIALLKEILAREPHIFCASLLLASILYRDNGRPEEAISIYDSLLHEGFQDQVLPDWLKVLTLVNKGVALGEMGKPEEEIAVYDEVIDRFGEAADLPLRAQVARALVYKGVTLGEMDKSEEEIRVYNEVVERFGASEDLTLRGQVARALVNKGVTLGDIGKYEEAIRVYDEVVKRFGDSADLPLREQVANALYNKGWTLGDVGKYEEAIRVYDEVVERFRDSADLPLREQVADALVNKGVTLGEMDKPEEEIRVYDEVVERFGEAAELPLREQVAKALLYKAECLLDADRGEDARVLFVAGEKEYLSSEKLKSDLASYYPYLRSRFASKGEPQEGDKTGLDITRKNLAPRLMGYLTEVLKHVDRSKQKEYFRKISDTKKRTDGFIRNDSRFASDFSFLLVLREWNSYTPVIPGEEESDRGGGYFILHAGEGIVIDPGYDFIENFYRAGGLLCDIDHVIVTHAHDDHTAELEALLMLFHRRWTAKNVSNRKPVSLYLSAGVQRKFAGLLDLREPKFRRVVTICPTEKGLAQRVRLNSETVLTVLPAYHDDVITQNSAVGLAFEFATNNGTRKVVFTGDSGLYPVKLDEDGKKILYDNNE